MGFFSKKACKISHFYIKIIYIRKGETGTFKQHFQAYSLYFCGEERITMKHIAIFVIISISLCICSPVLAVELYVGASQPYATIQSAIDDSNDGDIIEVAPEIYVQQFGEDIDLMGKDIIVRCSEPNDTYALASISSGSNAAQAHLASGDRYVPNELIVKFKKATADIFAAGISEGKQIQDLQLSDSLDKLNKKYKSHAVKALFKSFKRNRQRVNNLLKKDKSVLTKQEKRILKRLSRAPKGANIPNLDRIYKIKVELEKGQSLEEVVAAYSNDIDVEYAELNYIVSINLTPNDPLYSVQWPLNNTGQTYPESGRYNQPPGTIDCDIDAPEGWDTEIGSSEIIVAVVDTGVDYLHRDLDDNMWVNEAELNGTAGIDDDGNGYIDDIYGYDFINNDNDPKDDHGHGTHVAVLSPPKVTMVLILLVYAGMQKLWV